MGWKIITNHKDNWQIYSSSVDDVIAEFDSEENLKKWIAEEAVYDGKLKAIEHLMTFPSTWTVNDERVIIKGSLGKYHDWLHSLYGFDREENFKKIDKKLEKLLKNS